MKRKLLVPLIWVLSLVSIGILLGFVGNKKNSRKCIKAEVFIHGDTALHFFSEKELLELINNKGVKFLNQNISSINLIKIENILKEHPAVEGAEAYFTMDGNLKINVEKREPLLRIIDFYGDSYYIDKKGNYMSLIPGYTAYVPVVTGNIKDPWHKYTRSVFELKRDPAQEEKAVSDDIFELISEVSRDTFLSALAVQFNVNNERDIEMIPRIGPEFILIGDKTELPSKLRRLKLFYNQGLMNSTEENQYSFINLKYKNQIICSKKIK